MVRRALVGALLVTLLCAYGVAGHSWIRIGQVSGYMSRSGDYDYWTVVRLVAGYDYKFTCTMPWNTDFDLKLFFDLDGDGYYVDEDWSSTWRGERVAISTGTWNPEEMLFTPWFSGSYVIKVYSFSGYGSYTLTNYKWQ